MVFTGSAFAEMTRSMTLVSLYITLLKDNMDVEKGYANENNQTDKFISSFGESGQNAVVQLIKSNKGFYDSFEKTLHFGDIGSNSSGYSEDCVKSKLEGAQKTAKESFAEQKKAEKAFKTAEDEAEKAAREAAKQAEKEAKEAAKRAAQEAKEAAKGGE